jgi:hypothetical protein
VRASADELARRGLGVAFLHSTLVPQDETGFCVLAADSRELVEEAYARAGITFERIVESVDLAPSNTETAKEEEWSGS